jgi:hypothetical protein
MRTWWQNRNDKGDGARRWLPTLPANDLLRDRAYRRL